MQLIRLTDKKTGRPFLVNTAYIIAISPEIDERDGSLIMVHGNPERPNVQVSEHCEHIRAMIR